VRFEEIAESLRLIGLILTGLPAGDIIAPIPDAPENAFGIGWVEGWRGEVLIALETGAGNRIRRLHPHDPSWQNWPLLERAVLGNIVPDFPLINKSFNLSYSGHDL
jgi:Ni,Fe-hydrogenase III large subunit